MTLAHRLAVGAALATFSLTALTACSGDDATEGDDGPAPADEAMATAAAFLDETSGVDLSLSTDDEVEGDAVLLSAEGTVTDAPAFEGTASGRFQGLPANDVAIVSVDGSFTAEAFGQTLDLDPEELCAPDPALLLDPETGVGSILTGAEELGEGEEARGGADNAIQTSYAGTVPGEVMQNLLPCAPGDVFDATFLVDDEGYLRTATLTGEFFSGAGDITYTIAVDAYDVEKEITAP